MKDDADKIADQVRDLIAYAKDKAEETIWADTQRLAEIAFGAEYDCMYICMPGVDSLNPNDAPPLTIEVRDLMESKAVYSYDVVQEILDSYDCNPPEAVEKLEAAIASLEAGIQRLRNEAERLKAQS